MKKRSNIIWFYLIYLIKLLLKTFQLLYNINLNHVIIDKLILYYDKIRDL